MNILITGSSGFTGAILRHHLLKRGHGVFGLTTTPQVEGDIKADLLDPGSLRDCLARARPDAVVHLAGVSSPINESVAEIYSSNVVGTLNVLDAISRMERLPDITIVASSATVYAAGDGSPISEAAPVHPRGHYGISKRTVEEICQLMSDRLPLTITRPFNYTGPGQSTAFLVPKIVEHFVLRKPVIEVGNLDLVRDFSSVMDVVEAYARLIEAPKPGQVFNLCSGVGVRLESLIEMAAEITGHHIGVRQVVAHTRSGEPYRFVGARERLDLAIGSWEWAPVGEVLADMIRARGQTLNH